MTDPGEDEIDVELEAEIVLNILVLDVEPIPGLGDAPPGEPEEGDVEAPV